MARMIKSISNLVAIIIITLTAIVTFSTSLFAKPVAQWIFEDINKIQCTEASKNEVERIERFHAEPVETQNDNPLFAERSLFRV